LLLETFGREWLCVTPRSAYRCGIVFDVIDGPRPAWMASWPGSTRWRRQVSSMSFFASVALSRCATIHPTT
jgi:hypothetical protein